MRVEMYKCRFTGQLFELKDKKEYIKHLKEVRKQLKDAREEKRIRDTFDQWLKKEKETITHIDMIVPWILKNQRFLIKSYSALKYSGPWSHEKMYPVSDEFVDLTLTASYDPLVSNSHSCPHNGVTNWGGMNKGAPRGYPGWKGTIRGKLNRHKKNMASYPVSNFLNFLRICTASGGGGNRGWSYGCEIFLADWPGLKDQVRQMEEDLIVKRLKGR